MDTAQHAFGRRATELCAAACARGAPRVTISAVSSEGERQSGDPVSAAGAEGVRRSGADLPKACPSCGTRYPADALFCSLDGAPLTTSPGAIAAAAATDPYVGREILGHIEIRQLVGIGSMGRVYRAFQRGIDRDVAVKILHRELSANQTLVGRFHREAKVASRLAHPHVVHVLLVGQLPDGAMYIVMEYLDGMSLQSALAAAGSAMPLPRALHIALQLCDAAGEAHAQGIVHRDLKPENVMLVLRADDPDFVKILDFGIARLNWDEASTATAAGLIFGTARYISPEGAQGERVGPQGDVYSIATMIYQMLAGRTPFDADQAVAILVQQIHDPPAPLKAVERASYVPEPVAAVVMKNLAKKPDERAPDARAFGRALLEAAVSSGLSAQDILARPALLGGGRASHASVVQMPSIQRTKQLSLEPDVAARIDAAIASTAPSSGGRPVQSTAYETPAPAAVEANGRTPSRTEIADPAMLPPTTGTTKWTPAAEFEARLSKAPPVDVGATMDDQHEALARSHPPRAPTAVPAVPIAGPRPAAGHSAPALTVVAPMIGAPPSLLPVPPPLPASAMVAGSPMGSPTPPPLPVSMVGSPSFGPPTSPPTARPPSSVDATLAGEAAIVSSGRFHAHRMTLMVFFFLVGASAAAGIAWRAGLVHKATAIGSSAGPLTRDEGSPPWATSEEGTPTEPQVGSARGAGSESIAPGPSVNTPLAEAPAVPPLASTLSGPAMIVSAPAGLRVELDPSGMRPGIGQPVDFAARIVGSGAGARQVDGARFRISGPGLAAGTELPAADDGSGVFRTTFTFLQTGRFDVRFTARVDGTTMSTSRSVAVGDAVEPQGPPSGGAAPPSVEPKAGAGQTGKWL